MPTVTPTATNTAVITGASSGIGAELARQLSARGWHISLVARRRQVLEQLATELGSDRCAVFVADLTERSARDALFEELTASRTVDVLVNNAGWSTTGSVAHAEVDKEIAMVQTNVEAVVHLCAAFIPSMVARGAGMVLNVASVGGYSPVPGQAGYGATKAFVLSYTQAIHAELRGSGVTATALCPGPVETGFAEAAGFNPDEARESLPNIMWLNAEEVARQVLEAMFSGKIAVIPGIANRVTAHVGSIIPRSLLLPLIARRHPSL